MAINKLNPSEATEKLEVQYGEKEFLTVRNTPLYDMEEFRGKLAWAVGNILYSVGNSASQIESCNETCEKLMIGIHFRIQTVITAEGDHINISALAPTSLYEDVLSHNVDTYYCLQHGKNGGQKYKISLEEINKYLALIAHKVGIK